MARRRASMREGSPLPSSSKATEACSASPEGGRLRQEAENRSCSPEDMATVESAAAVPNPAPELPRRESVTRSRSRSPSPRPSLRPRTSRSPIWPPAHESSALVEAETTAPPAPEPVASPEREASPSGPTWIPRSSAGRPCAAPRRARAPHAHHTAARLRRLPRGHPRRGRRRRRPERGQPHDRGRHLGGRVHRGQHGHSAAEAVRGPDQALHRLRPDPGLGLGADPDVGRRAAEEAEDQIKYVLRGSDMALRLPARAAEPARARRPSSPSLRGMSARSRSAS